MSILSRMRRSKKIDYDKSAPLSAKYQRILRDGSAYLVKCLLFELINNDFPYSGCQKLPILILKIDHHAGLLLQSSNSTAFPLGCIRKYAALTGRHERMTIGIMNLFYLRPLSFFLLSGCRLAKVFARCRLQPSQEGTLLIAAVSLGRTPPIFDLSTSA